MKLNKPPKRLECINRLEDIQRGEHQRQQLLRARNVHKNNDPTRSTPIERSQLTSQLRQSLSGRSSRVHECFVNYLQALRGVLTENCTNGGCQATGDERPLANPVVVEVTIDGAEVIREVDIDSGSDHGDKGEEEGV